MHLQIHRLRRRYLIAVLLIWISHSFCFQVHALDLEHFYEYGSLAQDSSLTGGDDVTAIIQILNPPFPYFEENVLNIAVSST